MMGKDKYIHKLYAFALAAVFALTLAGCGGGGGTAAMPDPEPPVVDPGPTPEEMEAAALKDAQDGAMAAYMAAMAAVGGAVDPVAATNAQAAANMAKAASDAAAAATTSAMAMEYQTAAEGHRDSAMAAAGMRGLGLTALANKITNQADIDNAILEGTEPDDPVSNATRVGAALATTAAATATITTGDVSQGTAASADATYGASGPTFAVTGVGTALGRGEAPALLTTRGGWMGREMLEDAGSDAYVNVYTDIQADTPGRPVPGDLLTSGGTNLDISGLQTLAAATTKPVITGDPGDGSTFSGTLNVDPGDNNPPISGVFTCPADTACAIATNDDGGVVSIAGYELRAVSTATGAATPDADYLAWGVWLTVPDDAATDATAGAFASGNMVFNVDAALTGTATYNGVASGMYAASGMVEYFDADASLTANFGGSVATAAGLLGAVTGTVSNIRAGGMDVDGSLTLGRAPVTAAAGGFTGATSGSLAGRAVSGAWGGQFYGPSTASQYPTTAAGTFGASAPGVGADTVRILGSFGTWRAE